MARQSGRNQIVRTTGHTDISTNKFKVSYLGRRKESLSAVRIASDDRFKRTRENAFEFMRAGKASKVIIDSLKQLIKNASDTYMFARLTGKMMKVITADKTNIRGFRNVVDGDVKLLKGFEFNIYALLTSTIAALFDATIDRTTGKAEIDFPDLAPSRLINAPKESTHFQLHAVGAEIDFDKAVSSIDSKSSQVHPLSVTTMALQLACRLPAGSKHPLFLVLGIEFFREMKGTLFPMKNRTGNSLGIVQVCRPQL